MTYAGIVDYDEQLKRFVVKSAVGLVYLEKDGFPRDASMDGDWFIFTKKCIERIQD